ncbi:hypothetical protein LguiB_025619 [Lonicera macranthoides]
MGDRYNPSTGDNAQWVDYPPKNYALSGKIMLSAIVILFAVVIFIVALHVYARWYLLRVRVRRRSNLHHRRRQLPAHYVFYVDPNSATPTVPTGLDPSVISSLPVFSYSSQTHATALECAVCLSEFEDNENGRLLPKCQHYFHIDCIDMWFQSHSTCPLCRSAVEPASLVHAPINNQNDVVLSVGDPGETDPGSGSTSIPDWKKDLVEIPGRNELEDESRVNSQTTQVARSAGTRMMSLKRMLSMNRKAAPAGSTSSCGNVVNESDLELGKDESTHVETRAHAPR